MDPELLAAMNKSLAETVGRLREFSLGLSNLLPGLNSFEIQLSQTIGTLEGWAKALSPATVATFQRAMDNLSATLGQSAVPLFQSLIVVVDKVSGALLLLANEFGPILQSLSNELTRPILDLVHAFADVGIALAPVVQLLIAIYSPLVDLLAVLLSAGIVTQWEAMTNALLGVTPSLDSLRSAAQQAAKEVILFAARLAASLGATGFVDNLIKFIERRDDARGLQAAPQNVKTEDFAAIARDMVQASFAAGPGGGQKNEREFLRDILGELKDIRANPLTLQKLLEKGFEDIIAAIARLAPQTFRNAMREALDGTGIRDTAAGRILDNLLSPRIF